MVKTTVSYSTFGFRDRELPVALDAILAAGFDSIELSADHSGLDQPIASTAARVRKQLESRGMTVPTMHALLGDHNPGTPIESLRRKNVAELADWLRFAGDIGADGVVVHAVPNPMFLPDGDMAQYVAAMSDAVERSLDELIPVAAASKMRILLENLYYSAGEQLEYPLMNMRQLRTFVDSFPAEQLGLVLDTGHAGISNLDPAAEIEAAGERLWGTHLQDVDGEGSQDNHWLPTHGTLDWDAISSALKRINYRGAWTFEVINPRYGESPEALAKLARAVADEWGL